MSPNDAEFLKTLLETFKVEGEEHIAAIGSGLVELEDSSAGGRRMEIVEVIFREAHSLKGAARAVNLVKLEGICQSLETIFAQVKAQKTPLSSELIDRLHQMVAAAGAEIAALAPVDPPQPDSPPHSLPTPILETPAEEPHVRSAAGEKAGSADSVRVVAPKLDAILRQAEELIASKASAAHRLAASREIHALIASWEKEWRKVEPEVRALQRAGESRVRTNGHNHGAGQTHDGTTQLLAFLDRNERTVRTIGNRISALGGALDDDRRALDRRVGDLLDGIKRVSMLPFSTLLAGFPKLVRDLCRDCGKDAELAVQGGDIEGGRQILDAIKDPLMHLVRNCIDHGIESPAERERRGKPRRAKITITVTPKSANKVELTVADDGAGIDTRKVTAAAARLGLLSNQDTREPDAQRVLGFVFQSGLSTSPVLTSVSGRGLGLAIVREKVEGLGGEVAVETQPGRGTTFRLGLPLTLATFRGILVRAGNDFFVVPTMYVQRVLRVEHEAIKSIENRAAIEFNGRAVSLVWLAEALGITNSRSPDEPGRKWPGVLLEWLGERIVFLVDEILHDQEVVVKSLGKQLLHVRNIAGAAVLESGKVAPVLNVGDLMRSATSMTPAASRTDDVTRAKSILVVEDSITSRTLLRGILESYGYAVSTAVSGVEAFALLENETFDLVVSDVEMPQMTGLDLTAKIRANRRLADLPVVLVTALDSREDRERGAEVGANAYIVKSSFDQSNLLEVVQRLI